MTILPSGEAAVLVVLGDRIDDTVNRRIHHLADLVRELASRERPAIGNPIPGYASLYVPFDPLALDERAAAALLEPLARVALGASAAVVQEAATEPAPLVLLPTRYGGSDGPDLDEVAALHGLRPEDVVELHASVDYRVHLVGFTPGFAYLGSLPAAIATPRRSTPRVRVQAGSVGIAGEQTGVYPFDSPGGWQLIGRTNTSVWDIHRDPPALLVPGTRVRFEPLRT